MVDNSKKARGLTADNDANIGFGNIFESLGVHLVAANQIVVNWTQVHSTTVSFRSASVNNFAWFKSKEFRFLPGGIRVLSFSPAHKSR